MRILLTADPELPVPPLLYGGIERIVSQLVDSYCELGLTVALVAEETSCVSPAKLYSWPAKNSRGAMNTLSNCRALRSAVSNFRPEVIHSFSRIAYMASLIGSTIPKVMSFQREPTGRTVSLANRIFGGTIRFTGCSEYIAARGREVGGGGWDAIHNFVDPVTYTFHASVPVDAPLVFLSRIEPIKGTHLAIDIAKRSGRKLLIAGNFSTTGPNGDYWSDVIKPQLCDQIEYVGTVNDEQKNTLLGSAAAMIVPIQWNEPFGIVFAESLACGTPVISCPTGALPEIVENGKHGFLISDVESGVKAVENLHTISRASCRTQMEEKFSRAGIVQRYLKLYETSIKGQGN